MKPILFLQSEVQDVYTFYTEQLMQNPIVYDEKNNLWAVYSYNGCKTILENSLAEIPPIHTQGLNEYAITILSRLTRLSNGEPHRIAREIASRLFQQMQPVALTGTLCSLLPATGGTVTIDWVTAIAKKLPALALFKGFGFTAADCDYIVEHLAGLPKLLLPVKTSADIAVINELSKEVYLRIEKHIGNTALLAGVNNKDELMALYISNLAGLIIQSYDAGRGILSNALLHYLRHENNREVSYIQKMVTEVLRYDPPIHNTRRLAMADIVVENVTIKKGQSILVVLAAANRDPQQFDEPGRFIIHRTNNHAQLTFGAGAHACIASQFSINLATTALHYLFSTYSSIRLHTTDITYEAMINARLPETLILSLTR